MTQTFTTNLTAKHFLGLLLTAVTPAQAQYGAPDGDWPYWGGDAGSTRYSALDQINKDNAQDLEIAWRWYTANYGPSPEFYLSLIHI